MERFCVTWFSSCMATSKPLGQAFDACCLQDSQPLKPLQVTDTHDRLSGCFSMPSAAHPANKTASKTKLIFFINHTPYPNQTNKKRLPKEPFQLSSFLSHHRKGD